MAERIRPYRPQLKRRLSDAQIEKRFNFLVEIGHPKIVRDNKTLEYFKKMENRQELIAAYTSSRDVPAARNKPGFDPEKVGYTDISLENQAIFEEKLNSNLTSDKVRGKYISALNSVRKNGGMNAPPRLRQALSRARASVIKNHANKVRVKLTDEAIALAETNPELLTDEQQKLITSREGVNARRNEREREKRRKRGLRGKIATLSSQEDKLRESPEAFVRRTVRDGLKGWLKANPEYVRLGEDGIKLTVNQQFDEYWRLLPDWEKENWAEEIVPIQEHNNKIIKKYHDMGQVVPQEVQANDLKQLHHIQPKRGRREEKFGRVRGGHFPSQTVAVKGDAFSGRKSAHGLLHDPALDYLYAKFKDQNHMVFDFNDPNVISGSGGKPKPNVKGLSYLGDLAKTIMNLKGVKPVLKAGAKAVPILGYAAGAKGAVDYGAKHPILSTISGLSAVPGFGDVFGLPLLGAEVFGNIWNMDKERMRKRKEGVLGEAPKRYRGFGGILN